MPKPVSFRATPLPSAIFLASALLLSPSIAFAYCGIAEESAVGPNQAVAGLMATQKARQGILKSGGYEALRNTQFSGPQCLYLDDGTNRVSCTVRGEFCVTPKLAGPQSGEPQLGSGPIPAPPAGTPAPGQKRVFIPMPAPAWPRQTCVTYRARATGSSTQQAAGLADQALRQSFAQQGLQPVSFEPAACLPAADGSHRVTCVVSASTCP